MSLDGTHAVMRTRASGSPGRTYAPGLEWSDYQPLLPDREIVVGDPADPGALDGVDVLVAAAVDAELSDVGASASSSKSAAVTARPVLDHKRSAAGLHSGAGVAGSRPTRPLIDED
jgi:hypothetical protein